MVSVYSSSAQNLSVWDNLMWTQKFKASQPMKVMYESNIVCDL